MQLNFQQPQLSGAEKKAGHPWSRGEVLLEATKRSQKDLLRLSWELPPTCNSPKRRDCWRPLLNRKVNPLRLLQGGGTTQSLSVFVTQIVLRWYLDLTSRILGFILVSSVSKPMGKFFHKSG